MCKSEYKLIRKMQWDGDVLKVQDTMHDVLREAKQAAEDAMTGMVLSHFECDFSDFREYMHDKIKWEQKQRAAMPKWIPVTERFPEENRMVLCYTPVDGYTCVGFCRMYKWGSKTMLQWNIVTAMRSTKTLTKKVTHWMDLPEKPETPKEEDPV